MVPADGIEAFFSAPEGTYLAGRTWLYFCRDERLFGQVYWGRPDPLDIERLLRSPARLQHGNASRRRDGDVSFVGRVGALGLPNGDRVGLHR